MPTKTNALANAREALAHSKWWFLTVVLPQGLLLLLNVRAYRIASGDMTEQQLASAGAVGGALLVVFLLSVAAIGAHASRRVAVNWLVAVLVLLMHIAYVWFATAATGQMLPDSVRAWILPGGEFLFYQYACMMPGLFHAGLLLGSLDLGVRRKVDSVVTLAALVLPPVIWYAVLRLLADGFLGGSFAPSVLTGLFVALTVLVLIAFHRFLLFVHGWLTRRRHRALLLVVAAWAAPLGGLWLNARIPFPFDFQGVSVYVLTVLNGVALLVPSRTDSRSGVAAWMLRGATYPFTVYFFVVFLPFLPLSLLAMIACGAGFLILAPTFLFLVHTRFLAEETLRIAARLGRGRAIALLALSIAVLPTGFVARALLDRAALSVAIDAVYHSRSPDATRKVNRVFLRSSLRHLRRVKKGLYLPFVTEGYRRIVFDGMVLPAAKMDHIHHVFFGEPLPQIEDRSRGFLGFVRGRRRAMSGDVTLPSRAVRLADVAVTTETSEGQTHATVELVMQNEARGLAEFATELHVPAGVLIERYELDMRGTAVRGRIFERKSAMWVYHMIRDTERIDPGLLVYETPTKLRLRVYPFRAEQERTCRIRFLFPAGAAPAVRIGERTVRLGESDQTERRTRVRLPGGETALAFRPAALSSALQTVREPVAHLILDGAWPAATAEGAVGRVFANLAAAGIENVSPVLIVATHRSERYSLDSVPANLPWEGGFWADRAVLNARAASSNGAGHGPGRAPVYVAIPAPFGREVLTDERLAWDIDAPPDVPGYLVADRTGFRWRTFDGRRGPELETGWRPAPVVRVERAGGEETVVAADAEFALVDPISGEGAGPALRTPQGDPPSSAPPVDELPAGSAYALGLALWRESVAAKECPPSDPAVRKALVARSRTTGVLIPHTALIVVENQAQWEMLKRKERQALNTDAALEFDEFQESPAPPIIWFIPVVLFMAWRGSRGGRPVRDARHAQPAR